ncbi:MAG: SUMF1/EgtB/PvdO family nonheme iron enzyme, partial [Bacteroidota bacterium]
YTTTLPASYPKGYNAFYCMKYEISQGQYSAFLNTLDAASQFAFYPNEFNDTRNRVSGGGTPPDLYYSDRPDRAHNFMSWRDLLAYLDWAALRPMTELQYEKATRGFGPYVEGEFAWGSTAGTPLTTIATPEDGTELSLTVGANCRYNVNAITGGDGGAGPVRVGIFATGTTTTRQQTGASFFGIMEMSGNLWEQCVAVRTEAPVLAYDGRWGDGYIDAANGVANVTNWPYQDCPSGTCYRTPRGGYYASGAADVRTADRSFYYYGTNSRQRDYGGRGIR